MKSGKIRVLALGLVKHENKTLLSQGFDPQTGEYFYRAMGGGVDFGETSLEALQREFKEEIDVELTNIKYLGCLESIFVFKEQKGHEIIQLYQCDFIEQKLYELEQIDFNEGKRQKTAFWVDINKCLTGELRVVLPEFLEYL